MAVDQSVEFDGLVGLQPFCSADCDMLDQGFGGDLLLGGCGSGDVVLDYPAPRDVFVKGYGLLGDEERIPEEQSGSAPKRARLSLQLKRKPPLSDVTNTHFAEPVTDEYSEKAAKGVILATTVFNTRWAIKNFVSWAKQRNERLPDDPVPSDLFESNDADKICKFICLFVLETRREDGKPYPSATTTVFVDVLWFTILLLLLMCHAIS